MKLITVLATVLIFVSMIGCSSGRQPAGVPVGQSPTEANVETPQSTSEPETKHEEPTPLPDYDIVNVLPKDAIPAIFNPKFLSAAEADKQYDPTELVLGVEIDGDARAYSIPYLSGHEIVNDTVGGVHIAVTW